MLSLSLFAHGGDGRPCHDGGSKLSKEKCAICMSKWKYCWRRRGRPCLARAPLIVVFQLKSCHTVTIPLSIHGSAAEFKTLSDDDKNKMLFHVGMLRCKCVKHDAYHVLSILELLEFGVVSVVGFMRPKSYRNGATGSSAGLSEQCKSPDGHFDSSALPTSLNRRIEGKYSMYFCCMYRLYECVVGNPVFDSATSKCWYVIYY